MPRAIGLKERGAARVGTDAKLAQFAIAISADWRHGDRQHKTAIVVLAERLQCIVHPTRRSAAAEGASVLVEERLGRHEEGIRQLWQQLGVHRVAIAAANFEEYKIRILRYGKIAVV